MPLLPRRFERIKAVLNRRMADLTVLVEGVNKPHNISAILRSCDAIGVLDAHAVCKEGKTSTFNSTAQGSQKWVYLHEYPNIDSAVKALKERGFRLYGTKLGVDSDDYRNCDFTGPTAFVLGAEKWGLSESATNLMDKSIYIPMRGMVQSLNVSVAAATLLFEALRQREIKGLLPESGEGLNEQLYDDTIFEWAYPEVAKWCKLHRRKYPALNDQGEIMEFLPRTIKLHY